MSRYQQICLRPHYYIIIHTWTRFDLNPFSCFSNITFLPHMTFDLSTTRQVSWCVTGMTLDSCTPSKRPSTSRCFPHCHWVLGLHHSACYGEKSLGLRTTSCCLMWIIDTRVVQKVRGMRYNCPINGMLLFTWAT